MASSLAKTKSHHRQAPHSNSASSSSIITVQRAASVSPRNGARPSVSTLRPQSPNELNLAPAKLSVRTLSPDTRRRSSAVYNRPDSGQGVREGVGNLNRWSQSTASSKSSATHNRRGSLSKRLSGSFGSFGGFSSPQLSPNALTKAHTAPRENRPELAATPALVQSQPKLPPLITSSSLSRGAHAANTPSTATSITPTTADLLSTGTSTSSEPSYFGEKRQGQSPSKQSLAAPLSIAVSSFATKPISQTYLFQSSGSESSRPPISTDPLISSYPPRGTSHANHSEQYQRSHQRHSRNRESRKGSVGTEGESSTSSVRSTRVKAPRRKTTAMLSKALQKANHAVLLDNAQNFEGAMDAYTDACNLLHQVMSRSSTDEDRRKLENVRTTYTNRINELRNIDISYQSANGKALPEPPRERDSQDQETMSPITDDDNRNSVLHGLTTGDANNGRSRGMPHRDPPHLSHPYIPPRRQSLLPVSYRVEDKIIHASEMAQSLLPPIFHVEDQILQASEMAQQQQQTQNQMWANSNMPDHIVEHMVELEAPLYNQYIPPPLSPWRSLSPALPAELSASPTKEFVPDIPNKEPGQSNHLRQDTAESTSWLDTIDESGGSSSESVHSRSSSIGLRRKRIRATSGATEAEFDAALDAAVEAAYDDGFEPDDEEDDDHQQTQHGRGEFASDARRNVEMAKEMVRQAEREEAIVAAKDREKRRLQERLAKRDSVEIEYGDDEEEEEERMLEEMTRDYIMDDSEYELQSKSALPRQSDSSGFSGRTWGSSIGSNPTSAGTSLSTVAEKSILPSLAAQLRPSSPPSFPPPSGALPLPPVLSPSSAPFRISNGTSTLPNQPTKNNLGVRERRLSGINVKKLKIETNARAGSTADSGAIRYPPPSTSSAAITSHTAMEPPKSAPAPEQSIQKLSNLAFSPFNTTFEATNRKELSPLSGPTLVESGANITPVTSGLTKVTSAESEKSVQSIPSSPSRFASKGLGLRKNFSSSSLKTKGLAAPTPDAIDVSPASSTSTQRKVPVTAVPILHSSVGTNFIFTDRIPMDGINLFESGIHSPITPGLPNNSATNAPLPLELCPELPLLRPFWFLRCIYQTIAHPRGAYISTKLFVPSSIWKVKNVKLKNVEEKVASCDLLSAALLKLAKVDTLDADAVLRELQFLENVMDQAQLNLSKKLGNDVGVVGMSSLFKAPGMVDEAVSNSDTVASKSANTNSKSYLSSWRKKRSKNYVAPSVTSAVTSASKESSKDGIIIDSLPMTSITDPKFPKRDLGRIQYHGPHSNYMAALARLCDAVQILDQIARQVEDPGLKHSSQTHVGLELGMRHAAEFFGFFICRFVIGDVSMMLDKFIKRGTEWVLA